MALEPEPKSPSAWFRFIWGCVGGIVAVLSHISREDIFKALSGEPTWTQMSFYIASLVFTLILAALGGILAAVNDDVKKPMTLIQLGVVAPALIASWTDNINIKSNALRTSSNHYELNFIAKAQAQTQSNTKPQTKEDSSKKREIENGIYIALGAVLFGAILQKVIVQKQEAEHLQNKSKDNLDQVAKFAITNKANMVCFTVNAENDNNIELAKLVRAFPADTYQVQGGDCRN